MPAQTNLWICLRTNMLVYKFWFSCITSNIVRPILLEIVKIWIVKIAKDMNNDRWQEAARSDFPFSNETTLMPTCRQVTASKNLYVPDQRVKIEKNSEIRGKVTSSQQATVLRRRKAYWRLKGLMNAILVYHLSSPTTSRPYLSS